MNEFAESLERLLAEVAAPKLAQALEESGFLDAMVPQERGGAGLSLADAFELFVLEGKYAPEFPLAMTIAGRAGLPVGDRQPTAAAVTAAKIVGALEKTLDITLAYANERVQFGKPIGKFQAIQHQLAVMAEQVAAARMAAQIGCSGGGAEADPLRAAAAKSRASEAAAIVAPLAHAIHGAMGITAEYDLQRFTKRLHQWRAEHGSELAWNRVLGRALLDGGEALTLDFMRGKLLPG